MSASARRVRLEVSSVTGNTRFLAERLAAALEREGWQLVGPQVGAEDANAREAVGESDEASVPVVLCFWCWRSGADPRSLKRLESLEGRQVIAVGTLGSYPVGVYADKVRARVREQVSARNRCLGVFLSQGKVPVERIEKRKALPPEHPHHLDEAGERRLLESLHHPNERDAAEAIRYVLGHLARI